MQRYMATQKRAAIQKSRAYRIHPTFAGLSLITTAVLAFKKETMVLSGVGGGATAIIAKSAIEGNHAVPLLSPYYGCLRSLNIFICFVSAIATKLLKSTMFGNKSAERWSDIQGNLSMLFAALTACPGVLGRLMVHLNWSILFVWGVSGEILPVVHPFTAWSCVREEEVHCIIFATLQSCNFSQYSIGSMHILDV